MTSEIATPSSGKYPVLNGVLSDNPPPAYALLARAGRGILEVLVGDVKDVDQLADIPLGDGVEVLAAVPYQQVAERGYEFIADDAPLRCLVVTQREEVPLELAQAMLPAGLPTITAQGFDVSDEEYTATVRDVIENEIGKGEGANFVIRRNFVAKADASAVDLAPRVLRSLLDTERGAYWTFALVTPGVTLVGASPERHVSVADSRATMNPISGTFRHPSTGVDPAEFARFLVDTKEVEELFMVVDEELKMMSAVCTHGGVIEGPFLKEMSRVTHTEYLLSGDTDLDVRDVLRETMFAPTVTGSPMQNACSVIARHEKNGRGYYSGVLALMSPEDGDRYSLDAPILIRTAQISDDGEITVAAGATLVRHSTPEGEVAETAGKAAGMLGALGLTAEFGGGFGAPSEQPSHQPSGTASPETAPAPADTGTAVGRSSGVGHVVLADNPEIQAALAQRNHMLAPFWLASQQPKPTAALAGKTAVVIDAEDRFTTMLAHQLRHLGMSIEVLPWTEIAEDGSLPAAVARVDLLVSGPGPGDPRGSEERVARMKALVDARLAARAPLLAVCLSHQVLSRRLGLAIEPLAAPRQGVQLTIDFFGEPARLGFYNTYSARVADRGNPVVQFSVADDVLGSVAVEAAVDPATGDVFCLRGPGFASVQGHAESILSVDGLTVLRDLATHALAE